MDAKLPVFFKWIKTFVLQFIGKRALEIHSRRYTYQEASISVLGVQGSYFNLPSWDVFETIIRKVMDDGTTPPEVVNEIINILRRGPSDLTEYGQLKGIISIFQSIIQGKPCATRPYFLVMHCEAVLAALRDFSLSPYRQDVGSPPSEVLDVGALFFSCEMF